MNAILEEHGWTKRKATREDAEYLCDRMAPDVEQEFRQEGYERDAIVEEIMESDHRETWLLDGNVVCAFWSGWTDDMRSRTFGCTVVKPDDLDRKYVIARDSKAVLDDFMSREPKPEDGIFVLIPTWATRLNRHAERMAGLENVGMGYIGDVLYFIYRWKEC